MHVYIECRNSINRDENTKKFKIQRKRLNIFRCVLRLFLFTCERV